MMDSKENSQNTDVEFRMAELWKHRGKLERAIAGYEKVLVAQPFHQKAFAELTSLLQDMGDWNKAIDLCCQAIQHNPHDAELHKQHIDLLVKQDGIEAAFHHYELVRKDTREMKIHASDLLCCVVVRNELLRLPYFLEYYRKQGINAFFFVDNDSNDGTTAYLLDQPDIYLWQSSRSFNQANFGAIWFELLLRKYGLNHWCLIVDADELFYYPDCEQRTIAQLCQSLDEKNYKAYGAILLDMYSNKPIQDTHYKQGQNFLEVCSYFDRSFYHRKYTNATPYQNQTIYAGGVRERVFDRAGDAYLTKVPLLKYTEECVLAGGQHWTNYPMDRIAKARGCLLHFKYFSNFSSFVHEEAIRKQHYGGAMQYSQYAAGIDRNPTLTLYDDQHSLKFESVEQLVQLDIMRVEPPSLSQNPLDAEYLMAQLWHQRGKIERAIAGYQKLLAAAPTHKGAVLKLGELLVEQGDLKGAIANCCRALTRNPNGAEFHKHYIDLLIAEQGLEAAFEAYELVRKDTKIIEIAEQDLLCCVVVRNELSRLPYFLDYYRQHGVNRFLMIDNQSTDETLTYLLQQPDVYVWSSAKSFNQVNFGSAWFELLLRQYGVGHWCLTVDADELFYYPDCEHKPIPQLCQELEQKSYQAYTAILLDMYGDRAIQETHYTPGQNFLEVCPYFDRQYYHHKLHHAEPYGNQTVYYGGLRQRIFGASRGYMLNKVPLLKYASDTVLSGGQHFTNLPEFKIAKETGCLLHFKYFSQFLNYVAEEVQRKEHYGNACEYREYARALFSTSLLNLYDEAHSIKLHNSQQLVQLGILQLDADPLSRCF